MDDSALFAWWADHPDLWIVPTGSGKWLIQKHPIPVKRFPNDRTYTRLFDTPKQALQAAYESFMLIGEVPV